MFDFKLLRSLMKPKDNSESNFYRRSKLLPKHNYLVIAPEFITGILGIVVRIPENTELDLLDSSYRYTKFLPRTEKNTSVIREALKNSAYIIKVADSINPGYNRIIDGGIEMVVKYYFNTNSKPLITADRKFTYHMKERIPVAGICKSTVPFYEMDIEEYCLYMELNGFCKLDINEYI